MNHPVDREISEGGVLSIADIEITFINILRHDYEIVEENSSNYLRRYLKELILDNTSHAKSVPSKCQINATPYTIHVPRC